MKNKRRQRGLLAGVALACLAATAGAARAADHDDTPALKAMPRHDARITDLHVFTRVHQGPGRSSRPYMVLALCTNPTIPDSAATYAFPSDLTLEIRIDRHSDVDFAVDPEATLRYGGSILDPDGIAADITFTITFDTAGMPQLLVDGLDADVPISLFAGLRDDPFIRGPRQGRNSASVVIELPLQVVAAGGPHASLLVWAMSSVPGPAGPIGDIGARAIRSQLAANLLLNDYTEPRDHYRVLGLAPDVVIFDTARPAAFPNGRDLTDDVVDLVGDPGVLATDCPVPGDPVRCNPSANNLPFLAGFPYLAPPQGAATGNPGVVLRFGADDGD